MKNITKKLIVILTLLQLLTITSTSAKTKETRIALIIGNSHYSNNFGTLSNPANDATDMAATLKKLGFEVISGIDLKREEMFAKLDVFENKLRASNPDTTVGLFYYAGHGMEVDGENYLLPSDAKVTYQQDISRAGIKLNRIIKTMKYSNNRLNIVVLDACRNNPLPKKPNSRSVATGGWKEITELAEGMFIGYGTSKGREAADGTGRNGLFTKHLIYNIQQPGLTIERVFKNTRIAVNKESKKLGRPQLPTDQNQLLGDFYFIPPEFDTNNTNLIASRQLIIRPSSTPQLIPSITTLTRQVGEQYKDCTDCPSMVVIPSGSFYMGSKENDNEKPIHKVNINQFSMSQTEVTFNQWDACYNAGGCSDNPDDEGWGRGTRPVININWNDAQEYIKWLNSETSESYRLPSESEWEYAARAGNSSKYSWGDSISCSQAQYNGGRKSSCYYKSNKNSRGTSVVKSYSANNYGLYDMHGNVWEWVEDCSHGSYAGAPSDDNAWSSDCTDSSKHVLRSGSWMNDPDKLLSANRLTGASSNYSANSIGFRLAQNTE
ncbi:MAG: SUMF1/EgtB/PvdO family nonheme iron enzyme [Alcanivoracaceae bacterium]|nr:SUMF1/EgtB/PvdO family nonheme iron enzyme [Alcanivoracaceae bacterium]